MTPEDQKQMMSLQNQINTLITAQLITMRICYRLLNAMDYHQHPDTRTLITMGKSLKALRDSIERTHN